MDPSTIIGIILAFGALYAMIKMEGAHVESLILPAPMILVFGSTIAVGIASGTLKDFIGAMKAFPRAFVSKQPKPQATIDRLVGYAEKARKDGLLALEQEVANVNDPFLKTGLQAIADGTDAEDLRELLENEIHSRDSVSRTSAKFYNSIGGYAPTIGILGTVVSLTHVLENLSEPDKLGHAIAAAFVATLWGVLSANLIWLPIGAKLTRLADLETDRRYVELEGLLAVQAGAQPRMLSERLKAMVPPGSIKEAA